MLLDRIEIDNHGPLNRVELGPLSHHLNVVLGPAGSGKTAISRFIRDSLIDRDYPNGMLSSSSGRIVWVDANGWIHCRREQDGTPGGRRTVDFESRSENAHDFTTYQDGWFDPSAAATETASSYRHSLATRTLGAIRIPESIVDGVMVDTTVCNVSRVVASCLSAGLDREDLARLPFENETARFTNGTMETGAHDDDRRRRELRAELADVEAELAKYRSTPPTVRTRDVTGLSAERDAALQRRESLIARRSTLGHATSLGHASSVDYSRSGSAASSYGVPQHDDARLRTLHERAESLRARAASLQRWIAELEVKSGPVENRVGYLASSTPYHLPPVWQTASVDSLHEQLAQADREIVSLRRVLADVRGIRDMLGAASANYEGGHASQWLDRDWMQGRRYGHFVQAMDHYRSDRPWADFYNTAYQPLHPVDDLSIRIEAAQRHLQWLMSRFETNSPASTLGAYSSWIGFDERRDVMQEAIRRASEQIRHREYLNASHMDRLTGELHQTLNHLLATRARTVDSLARTHADWGRQYVATTGYHPDWLAERRAAANELVDVECELRRTLDESAQFRRTYRELPVLDSAYYANVVDDSGTRHSLDLEITRLDARLRQLDALIAEQNIMYQSTARPDHRIETLNRRLEVLIAELKRDRPLPRRESSLAELASRWLVRLSGGRHRSLSWATAPAVTDAYTRMDDASGNGSREFIGRDHRVLVSIDGVEESTVAATTRALASLAVRMAAGELLGRMGHALPLVLETHRELLAAYQTGARNYETNHQDIGVDPYRHWTREGVTSDAIASALSDYSAAGRQLLVLTEHAPLASSLRRSGARSFELHTEQIVHAHRPLWRSGQRSDHYVGPHGIDADGMPISQPIDLAGTEIDSNVNRAFDQAWIETAGLREGYAPAEHHFDGPHRETRNAHYRPAVATDVPATDVPASGATLRDGYYTATQSSTRPIHSDAIVRSDSSVHHGNDAHHPNEIRGSMVSDSLIARHGSLATSEVAEVPFFLTVDSPIDMAPSIDAVAAQRLRRIGISHITHLMNQDSNRLSDTLGLAGVDAKTIRRWQSECRLMCRVPQLRGFDARVLVGCGISDPAKLAAIHPTDLLDRVKTFLATERGQQILLSGTSYELSRITSWIASANHSIQTIKRTRIVDGHPVETRVTRQHDDRFVRDSRDHDEATYLTDDDFDRERYEVEVERRADRIADEIDELTKDYDDSGRSHEGRRSSNGRSSSTSRRSSGKGTSSSNRSSSSNRNASSNRGTSTSREADGDTNVRRTVSGLRGSSSSESRSRRSERNNSTRSTSRGERSNRERSSRSQSDQSYGLNSSNRDGEYVRRSERTVRTERGERTGRGERTERSQRTERGTRDGETTLRFYLERSSDVVDAPSIGPRMAERLNKIGIDTVDDLLNMNAESIAGQLSHRRVDAATVLTWQQQSTLVCRVPMMRGHDAQFLVAADVTTPEELAVSNPVSLFAKVDEIAHSSEGKRIVRGGKLPDLEEVTEWVAYANQNRSIEAAA